MLDIARWSTGIIIFTGFEPLPRRGGWLQSFQVTFNHNFALSRRCCGVGQRQHSTVTMWWQDWDQCQVGTMCKMAADCSEPGRSAHAQWPGWDSGQCGHSGHGSVSLGPGPAVRGVQWPPRCPHCWHSPYSHYVTMQSVTLTITSTHTDQLVNLVESQPIEDWL